MNRKILAMLTVMTGIGVATICPAQDTPKGGGDKSQQKTVQLKLEKFKQASSTNFASSLKLPFESLASLGFRIEQARKDSDPVALAALANELGVAEKVSGKKADVTSADLAKEATELASLRGVPEELQALVLMTSDTSAQSRLNTQLEAAKQLRARRAADAKAAAGGSGDAASPQSLRGTVQVINLTDDELEIRINGFRSGRSFANSSIFLTFFDVPGGTTRLEAISFFEGLKAFKTIEQDVSFTTFVIQEN